ncbi:hypothetical protein C9J51_19345 [Photobacterium iliopiscarium]|nr:hypothetical protein C9I85_19330 [Photobacterium iliopiscarium]PSV78493.1 hypothetical protein C9J51_19345 [Photobacterium iliopiscarium]
MTVVINRKLSGLSRLFFDGNGCADALVVMLAMAVLSTPPLLKKPESNDSGFFRLYKSKMMQNRHCGVVVQLVRLFIEKLSGQLRRGRADFRYGKSRPLHIIEEA